MAKNQVCTYPETCSACLGGARDIHQHGPAEPCGNSNFSQVRHEKSVYVCDEEEHRIRAFLTGAELSGQRGRPDGLQGEVGSPNPVPH